MKQYILLTGQRDTFMLMTAFRISHTVNLSFLASNGEDAWNVAWGLEVQSTQRFEAESSF